MRPSVNVQEGQKVDACLELVRDEYLVLTVPGKSAALGFAATQGWNQRSIDPHSHFRPGQRLPATIAALPSPATGMPHGLRHCDCHEPSSNARFII